MKSQPLPRFKPVYMHRQRGVVLFFALIALVIMSLAAVALIRSVDTSTMVASNLAFRQSATSSGDAGIEAAITWLRTLQDASGLDPVKDAAHPFNTSNPAAGYYSNLVDDPLAPGYLNLFADATWSISGIPEITDDSGNQIRYIIQRMCRIGTAGLPAKDADCLSNGVVTPKSGMHVVGSTAACKTCTPTNPPSQIRITARTTGPKNTVSYLQAFVF